MAFSSSSEEDLFHVKSDWNADNLTWGAFGNCTLQNIEDIEIFWFPENPVARARVHDIWKRHPQQEATSQSKKIHVFHHFPLPFILPNQNYPLLLFCSDTT